MAATKVAEIQIKGGTVELIAATQFLAHIPGATEKAIKRASKRAAAHGQTQITRAINRGSNIKSAVVREKMQKGVAGKNGSFVRLNKTGRLGLRNFKSTQTDKGVMFQVNRKGKWLFVPRAFTGPTYKLMKIGEVTGKGKKKTYTKFEQPKVGYITHQSSKWKGNAAVRVGKKRLPIVFIKGVSPAGFFTRNKLELPNKKEISEFFRKRLRHEILFIINSKKRKGK